MPGCSDTLAERCLPKLARSPLAAPYIRQLVIRLVAPHSPPRLLRLFAFRLLQIRLAMALNRLACARFSRHTRIRISIKLKCKVNIFSNTTAMPFSRPHIVCLTVVFHPICCSNAPIARNSKAATSSIRSTTSRVKSRHSNTLHAGHATGSTRADRAAPT